jgi:hypothetical protein
LRTSAIAMRATVSVLAATEALRTLAFPTEALSS